MLLDSMLKQRSEKFTDEHGVQDLGRDEQAIISRVSMESNILDAMLHNRRKNQENRPGRTLKLSVTRYANLGGLGAYIYDSTRKR